MKSKLPCVNGGVIGSLVCESSSSSATRTGVKRQRSRDNADKRQDVCVYAVLYVQYMIMCSSVVKRQQYCT